MHGQLHCLTCWVLAWPSTPSASTDANSICLQDLAKKKKIKTLGVSMGQGQEIIARKYMATATVEGQWVLLQNTHLGLGYLTEVTVTYTHVLHLAVCCNSFVCSASSTSLLLLFVWLLCLHCMLLYCHAPCAIIEALLVA